MTNRSISIVTAIYLLISLAGASAEERKVSEAIEKRTAEELLSEFDTEVAAGVEEDGGGCVIAGVFRGDQMIWAKGYGWADVENKIPASRDTISRVGSISKPMTAIVLVQQVERDVLGLDDPVGEYFPEIKNLANPPEGSDPITFRMLASHTAGLVREPDLADAASGPIARWEEKVILSIPRTGFRTPPNAEYYYSNIGYGILGLAVSRAAERPFMDMVTEDIFEPLEMTDSTFVVSTDEMERRLAVGYIRDDKTGEVRSELPTREHLGRGYKVPNGGVYSTVDDLHKFASAMMGVGPAQIISPESRTEVFSSQPPADAYGLGFNIDQEAGMIIVGHRGAIAGYNSELKFDLNSKMGIVVLRTTSYNPPAVRFLEMLISAESPE